MQKLSNNPNSNEIVDILDHIKQNEEEQQKFGKYKNVTLVLGPTGSGKSTFTQFITGNGDLEVVIEKPIDDTQSEEDRETFVEKADDAEGEEEDEGNVAEEEEEPQEERIIKYIIKDNNQKISSNAILSHTSFPDLVLNTTSKAAFYDCPGFDDSRSTAQDVASAYFVKKLIDSTISLKLIFVVPHSTLDGERGPFLKFLKHVSNMFNNLQNFNDSIAIIASLVPSDSHSDFHIKRSIAQFLRKCKQELQTSKYSEKLKNDSKNFIDILLEKTKKKKNNKVIDYPRIGIFRKANETGLLKDMVLFQKDKIKLEKIVSENIKFCPHDEYDFGYTISSDSRDNLHELVNKINDNIDFEIATFGQELLKYYIDEEKSTKDLQEVYEIFKSGSEYMTAIYKEALKVEDALNFKNLISTYFRKSNVATSTDNLDIIINYNEFLKFINMISNKNYNEAFNLAEGFKDVVEYLENSIHWYTFLFDLYDQLSKYDTQRDIAQHKDVHDELKGLIEAYNIDKQNEQLKKYLDEVIVKKFLTSKAFNNIKNVNFNSAKLKFLNDIINLTLNNTLDKSPDNQALVVKGPYIKMSDIINENHGELIKLFALNTVFIDTDLDKTGDHVQLFIVAPKLEIVSHHKIVLDGKPTNASKAECAKNGFGYGTLGRNGEPGTIGDSAGNFFAVVDTIIDGDKLTISANGSKGGSGQCGGNGSDGRKGINAEIPVNCEPSMCDERKDCNVSYDQNKVDKFFSNYIGIFNGTRVGNGGNGGNGGRGGFGGNPGKIIVIQTSEYSNIKNKKEINKYNQKGVDGDNGKSGIGGKGYSDGNDIIAPFYTQYIEDYLWCAYTRSEIKTIQGKKKLSGKNGIDGHNVQGLIQPKNVSLDNPAFIINQYKTYLIEHLNSTIQQSFLRSYLTKLEDKKVTDYYATLSLINELHNLEKQYLKLRDSVSMLPLYESLLNRVQEYAEKSDKQDEKIVLDYLIAATLSKMYRIQEYSTKSIIINLKDNLKSLRNEIVDLKNLHNIVENNKDQKLHEKLLLAQIEEAESLIETEIKPAINYNLNNIDNEIESMCNKIIELQKKTEEERKNLKEQRDSFNNFLALKSIFDVVMTATEFITNFAVPMMSVAETVMSSKTKKGGVIGQVGKAALGLINEGIKQYTSRLEKKAKSILNRVNSAWTAIQEEFSQNHTLFKSNNSLKKIFDTIKEVKGGFKEDKEPNIDEKSAQEMIKKEHEVAKLLENETNHLEKMKSDSKDTADTDKALKIAKNIKKAFSYTKSVIDTFVSNKSESDNPFDDSIKKVDAKIEELSMYEQNIYDILIPQYNKLQNEVTTIQDRLKNESSVALSISNWKMQSTMQDIGNELQKLGKPFLQLGNLEHFLNKLAKTMSLLTEVYDRIQETVYRSEFAAFLTKISNNGAMVTNIKDPALNKAISELDFIIKSNIVIEKYETAKNAFDVYVFPYGGTYLKMFKQPALTSSDYETLVVDVTKAIEGLESKLSDFKTTLNDPKSYIRPNKRFGLDVPALFEWKHSTIKPLISKLFRGEKIELKADIMQANIDKSAIKVNEIQIDFKPRNEKIKNELNEVLQKFEAELIRVGDSYYRCDNNVYRIPSKKAKLSINFHQQGSGNHRGEDAGFDDLASNDAVLSPYGTWQIKLSTNTSSDFEILKNYENQIMNITLTGKGSFIKFGSPYCNDDLKYTYSLSDGLTEDNHVDESLQEEIQNIGTKDKSHIYNENNSRRRRSIEKSDSLYNNEENQFMTSGAYSNAQSSFINNIFHSMRKSFVAFENLNPVNLVTKWLNKNENNFDHVILNNDVMEKKLLNYPSLVEIPKSSELMDQFINDENVHDVNFISNSLLYNQGNLLLLDLIIRSKNKLKYNHQNIEVHNDPDSDYAQKLAYKEYMPLQHTE